MPAKIEVFNQIQLKKELPDIRPGDTVKVYQKIKEKNKERIQIFEGLVLARKHGKGISSTITVRKVISGVGVEKIFPVHSPAIEKIEIIKRSKVRRAKLYYLREAKGKKARLQKKEFAEVIAEPSYAKASEGKEKPVEKKPAEQKEITAEQKPEKEVKEKPEEKTEETEKVKEKEDKEELKKDKE